MKARLKLLGEALRIYARVKMFNLLGINPQQVMSPEQINAITELTKTCETLRAERDAAVNRPVVITQPVPEITYAEANIAQNVSLITKSFYQAALDEKLHRAGVTVNKMGDGQTFHVRVLCVIAGKNGSDDELMEVGGTFRFKDYKDIEKSAREAAAMLQCRMHTIQ